MGKGLLFFACTALLIAACTVGQTPTAPTSSGNPLAHLGHGQSASDTTGDDNPNSGAHDDKGYIAGWFNGEKVELYYTKTYFCQKRSDSQDSAANCELGADAEAAPRPGPIPTIYAIAAAGIQPDLMTLSCKPGSVCLNHPAMIDASRVGGQVDGNPLPHSHILSERAGGWFHTVNIRVRNIDVWNQIADAKSLAKVRELQADPIVGVNGQRLIFADVPTNIFFFIASWRPATD